MSRLDDILAGASAGTDSGLPGLVVEGEGDQLSSSRCLSATVLEVDRWGLRRGEQIARQWHDAWSADHDALVVADAHAALFEPLPSPAAAPRDEARAAWWAQLMETPEYRAIHEQTALDAALSELGAKAICDEWQAYAEACAEEQPDSAGTGDSGDSDEEPIGETMRRIRSTAAALRGAGETIGLARDVCAGLGLDPGDSGSVDMSLIARYFHRARSDAALRRILEWAGRMRTLCRSAQRHRVLAERGEITRVELGGDVARLLPYEAMQVAGAVPELELLALYRLASRRALCYGCRRVEPVSRGPIVVCVDESGSMSGEPVAAAKGLALALAWLAREQRRWIGLVGFSCGLEGTRLAMPPDRWDPGALCEWLGHMCGGGTTLDVPCTTLPTAYWQEFVGQGLARGKTDVIIITDAIVHLEAEMEQAYRDWARAEQVRTYGIVVGSPGAGDLARICDQWWAVPGLDLDSVAVQGALSI